MLAKFFARLKSEALAKASKGSNRRRFAEMFGRATIFFLQIPPGFENGLKFDASAEEFLDEIRRAASDLSNREEFSPFCRIKNGRSSVLVFTGMDLATEFAESYVAEVKRAVPFGVLGVDGRVLMRNYSQMQGMVLNARTKHEHELSAEDIGLLKAIWAS